MSDLIANTIATVTKMIHSIAGNAFFLSCIAGVALLLLIANKISKGWLNSRLGILPRKLKGIPGLLCAPWLHGSFTHWLVNGLFFFILASLSLMQQSRLQLGILCLIISVVGGGLTWLLGRRAYHVGASGVVMGLWGYLLVFAFQHPSTLAIVIALSVFYFFGGMITNLAPTDNKTSWESHLFGAAAGIAAGLYAPLAKLLIISSTPI